MKKLLYYFIPFLLVAVGTSSFLFYRYAAIKETAIEQEKEQTATLIRLQASSLITAEDFTTSDKDLQQQAFESYWMQIQSPELVRIKVWDQNFTIIWSNLTEVIGQRFPDNHEVEEALEGEIEMEIERQKGEHVSERQYAELSETYVPFVDNEGKVVGVLEIYQPTIELHQEIRENFSKVAIPTVLVAFVIYFGAVLALRVFLKKRALRA